MSTRSFGTNPERSVHSMELALLQEMVNERDKQIIKIEDIIQRREDKLERVKGDLDRVRAEIAETRLVQRRAIADLKEKFEKVDQKRQALERDVRQQNVSLQGYAQILREQAVKDGLAVDSSYVVRLQSQLCKAMHSMGIVEHQLELMKDLSSVLVRKLREASVNIINDKSHVELSVMNELMAVDDSRRKIQKEYDESMKRRRRLMRHFEASMHSLEANNEEEEEESDEEIDEDLLEEVVGERKAEVEILEKKTQKQFEKIHSVQAKIKELQEQKAKQDPGDKQKEDSAETANAEDTDER